MSLNIETKVGKLAAEHPLATRVFARHGIDFCCGGGRPLGQVCEDLGIDGAAVLEEIRAELEAPPESRELTIQRLHYLEGSRRQLRLDMCSIMPKQGHFTISLIGRSVDKARSHRENLQIVRQFLESPRVCWLHTTWH